LRTIKCFGIGFYYLLFTHFDRIIWENNLYGITISTEGITKGQITLAHNEGLLVAIWNTHSNRKNRQAVEKNLDFIQTDRVKNLVDLLK